MVIGEFHRKQEIGKGSFAAVYLAQHRVRRSALRSCSLHCTRHGHGGLGLQTVRNLIRSLT